MAVELECEACGHWQLVEVVPPEHSLERGGICQRCGAANRWLVLGAVLDDQDFSQWARELAERAAAAEFSPGL